MTHPRMLFRIFSCKHTNKLKALNRPLLYRSNHTLRSVLLWYRTFVLLRVGCFTMEHCTVTPRIITARTKSKGRNVSAIQCYVTTNSGNEYADQGEASNQEFYDRLYTVLVETSGRCIKSRVLRQTVHCTG